MGRAIKYLNDIEECELVDFLLRCAKIGYPKSRKQVMGIVQRVIDVNGVMRVVSDGWWTSFSRRHPRLTFVIPLLSVEHVQLHQISTHSMTILIYSRKQLIRTIYETVGHG